MYTFQRDTTSTWQFEHLLGLLVIAASPCTRDDQAAAVRERAMQARAAEHDIVKVMQTTGSTRQVAIKTLKQCGDVNAAVAIIGRHEEANGSNSDPPQRKAHANGGANPSPKSAKHAN
eukprot:2029051-Prymnesium_polylepis.2